MGIEDGSLTQFAVVRTDWIQQVEERMVVVWYPQSRREEEVSIDRIRLRKMLLVPLVTVSDYKNHDTTFVQVYFATVLSEWMQTQEDHPGLKERITELHNYSDGAASHFKNKETIHSITMLLDSCGYRRVTWSFSCEAHGKGSKDGIADTVQYKSTGRILNEKLVMPLMYALVLTLYNLVYILVCTCT